MTLVQLTVHFTSQACLSSVASLFSECGYTRKNWHTNSTDSHQQNKAVFRVKWTHYLEEKLRMHAVTLALFSEVSALFGSIYRGGWPWRFSSSERHKGSPYPSNQVIIASQAFATSRNLPLSVCLYSGRRCERSRHMK